MNRKFLNLAMMILFLLTMSFHFLPRIFHEIFGVIMAIATVIHVFINRRQFFGLMRGKISIRKIFAALIILSAIIIFIIILISGVCMSNHLFRDFIPMAVRRNMLIHQLHVSMPYIFMILIGCHIGLHWREIFKIKNFMVQKIFMAVVFCIGVYGSFLNRVGDRILMKHIFATPATELSLILFLIILFSTTIIYAVIIFILDEKIRLCKNKSK